MIDESDVAVPSGDLGEISYEDRVRMDEEIESIRFYVEQGYDGLADKSLGELETEFGNIPELVELRDQVGGLSAAGEAPAPVATKAEAADEEVEAATVAETGAEEFGLSGKAPSELANDLVEESLAENGSEEAVEDYSAEKADDAVADVSDDSAADLGFEFQPSTTVEEEAEEEASEVTVTETAQDSPEEINHVEPDQAVVEDADEVEAVTEEVTEEVDSTPDESLETESAVQNEDESVSVEEPIKESDANAEDSAADAGSDDEEQGEIDFNNSFANLQNELGLEADEEEATDDDYDNHYHHAIAYKEMGLVEEAIREFQDAVNSIQPDDGTKRYLSCCTLLGDCFLEKGMPNLSVIWFKKALETTGLTADERHGVVYELANAHELCEEFESAMNEFESIYAEDVDYRDVSSRLSELKQKALTTA